MTIITIPREFVKEKELVLIPRKKFEELLRLAKSKIAKVITPTEKITYDLSALKKLERETLREYRGGKTRTISTPEELGLYLKEIRRDTLKYGANRS